MQTLLGSVSERARKTRDVVATRCQRDGWAAEPRACMVATTSLRQPRGCKAKLTADQRAAFDRDLAALETRRPPAACNDYREMIEKLSGCRMIPETARAAFEQGYREIAQTWSSGAQYDVRAIEVQCRSMAEGLRMVIAPACGW